MPFFFFSRESYKEKKNNPLPTKTDCNGNKS